MDCVCPCPQILLVIFNLPQCFKDICILLFSPTNYKSKMSLSSNLKELAMITGMLLYKKYCSSVGGSINSKISQCC